MLDLSNCANFLVLSEPILQSVFFFVASMLISMNLILITRILILFVLLKKKEGNVLGCQTINKISKLKYCVVSLVFFFCIFLIF